MRNTIVLHHVKYYREKLGITQAHLAELCELHPRTIQRIEKGEPTTVSTAKDIAASLSVTNYTRLQKDTSARDAIAERLEKEREADYEKQYSKIKICAIRRGLLLTGSFLILLYVAATLLTQSVAMFTTSNMVALGMLAAISVCFSLMAMPNNQWLYILGVVGLPFVLMSSMATVLFTGMAIHLSQEWGILALVGLVVGKLTILVQSIAMAMPSIHNKRVYQELGLT